jgi:MFS family permease
MNPSDPALPRASTLASAGARRADRPGTFRSLRVYNYRTWAVGALVSNVGTWMQRTAQDWIVLTQLTHRNATAVGVVMALQFGPQVLMLPLSGFAADHLDRRKLVIIGVSAQTFTTTTNSVVQLSTEPAMRGRVMAILLAVALGGTPIGAPIVGRVVDAFGPRWALGVGAAGGFAAALVGLLYLTAHHERHSR